MCIDGYHRTQQVRIPELRIFGLAFIIVFLAETEPASWAKEPQETLYRATPLTQKGEFTRGIEGPACDREGNIFAVNFGREQSIGKISPSGHGKVWMVLPGKGGGNGIVFAPNGTMFVADPTEHTIWRIAAGSESPEVFVHEPTMNQPNDLAIAPDGSLYASDPDWKNSTGNLWHLSSQGIAKKLQSNMGTTNGIEVSPDGKWLFVNETVQRNIWRYPIHSMGAVGKLERFHQFTDHGMDGMRCDVEGNLYVTRYGKGTVAILNPKGEVIREIDVLGSEPSNLCFGGPDGKTVYVTEVEHTRIVQFRTDTPGAAWSSWNLP